MLRRLALSGLRGRPKQTMILLTTMILSFFFVTIAMNLLSTSQVNHAVQRRDTFGEWSNVFIADTLDRQAELTQADQTVISNRILGSDDRFGIVAAADASFKDMAHIKLLEGHWPTKLNEIVLTESQISFFPAKPAIGDTITVTLDVSRTDPVPLEFNPQISPDIDQIVRLANQYIAEHWDETHQLVQDQYRNWQNSKDVQVSSYLNDLRGYQVPMVESEVRERYLRIREAGLQRQLDFFAQTIDPADRIDALEKFQANELEQKMIDVATDPSFVFWHKDSTPEEMQQAIASQFSPEGLIGQYLGATIPRNSSQLEGAGDSIFSTRQSSWVIRYSPTQLQVFSPLFQYLPSSGVAGIDAEQIFTRSSEIVIHREMVVTGIINNYHQVWDGPTTQYATAFVAPITGQQLIEQGIQHSAIPETRDFVTPYHLFIKSADPTVLETKYPEQINLFSNNLGFGQESGLSEDALSLILLVVIALITFFSIFQISLIQFRKRLRKLALFRAIGATFRQLRTLLVWESFYLILWALPVGSLLGFGLSYLLVYFNNLVTGDQMVMHIYPSWLILGYGLALISILIGLFFPMIWVRRVPLRGHVPTTSHKTMKTTRERIGDQALAMQNLDSLNRRHNRFIRKQQLINLGLLSAILLILIGSYLLIYLSFDTYRSKTIHADMPDFELEAPFQQSLRVSRELDDQIRALPGVNRTEIFVRGLKAFLWYDGIAETPLNQAFRQLLPTEFVSEHFGSQQDYRLDDSEKHQITDAALTDIYGIVPDSRIEIALRKILPADFDLEKFRTDRQAILLLPGYQLADKPLQPVDSARLESVERTSRMKQVLQLAQAGTISYDIRRADTMNTDHLADQVKEVKLSIPLGATYGPDNTPVNTVKQFTIPVVKVLNYLPEEGFWPLSDSVQSPILLMSQYSTDFLYPYRMHSVFNFDLVRRYFGDEPAIRFGSTIIQVDGDDITQDVATEVKRIGFKNGYSVKSLYLQKQSLFTKGLRTSLIIGLLAGTLLLIAVQIQTSSFRGQLEVERQRIGILQSLGVTEVDFRKAYLKEAIVRVIQAIILTHVAILVAFIGYFIVSGKGSNLLTELKIILWDYNWLWHGLIVLLFAILSVIASYLPVGRILSRQPVENIRSLN